VRTADAIRLPSRLSCDAATKNLQANKKCCCHLCKLYETGCPNYTTSIFSSPHAHAHSKNRKFEMRRLFMGATLDDAAFRSTPLILTKLVVVSPGPELIQSFKWGDGGTTHIYAHAPEMKICRRIVCSLVACAHGHQS
jgi:hypothetical protein